MNHSKLIADRLRRAAAKDGRTQQEIAAAAGVSQATLCRILYGSSQGPRLVTLIRVCRELGVSPTVLVREVAAAV